MNINIKREHVMESVVKRLFLGGSLLTALAVSLTAMFGAHAVDAIPDVPGICTQAEIDAGTCKYASFTTCHSFLVQEKDGLTGLPKFESDGTTPIYTQASQAVYDACVIDHDKGVSATSNFTIRVPKTIVLTNVTDGTIEGQDIKYNAINTTTISATVQANTQYALYLSATKPDLVNEGDGNYKIPASSTVTAGTNGWGIMKKADEGVDGGAGTYTALTTALQQFFASSSITAASSATETTGETTIFNVGIGIADNLESGKYSTQVTVTASTSLTNS